MIVLDTSVLISAFRRRGREPLPEDIATLKGLIEDDAPLAVPGIVCQELLAGAQTEQQFERLDRMIAGFEIMLADQELHRRAARIAAACRWVGVTTTTADCLIAAHTIAANASLFTLDQDFAHMARCCGLQLYSWR